MHKLIASSMAMALVAGQICGPVCASAPIQACTPIKHVVVTFFRRTSRRSLLWHISGGAESPEEPRFEGQMTRPAWNGLLMLSVQQPELLNTSLNGAAASNPFRLDRSKASTMIKTTTTGPEQEAFHGGLDGRVPEVYGRAWDLRPTGQTTNASSWATTTATP